MNRLIKIVPAESTEVATVDRVGAPERFVGAAAPWFTILALGTLGFLLHSTRVGAYYLADRLVPGAYAGFANALMDTYPASAKVFIEMAEEEHEHRRWLTDLYRKKFGDFIPLIRRGDINGYLDRVQELWYDGFVPVFFLLPDGPRDRGLTGSAEMATVSR